MGGIQIEKLQSSILRESVHHGKVKFGSLMGALKLVRTKYN